jgi:AcrR family transcriptional regulator
MDTQDRRVKRTQKLLAKALIALTLERNYDAITIRDITDRADIGYATFFRHYHDKDELLKDVLEVALDELTDLLQRPMDATNHEETGTFIFRYVKEHSELIHVLLSSHRSSELVKHIIETGTQSVFTQNACLAEGVVPQEIAAYHLVTATMSLIQWWIEHQMMYSPERMGAIYAKLIAEPTQVAAFR